ncbi:MAG TPA: efflux RND transporter permease subunit [Spirochaetia bacterium]|nr:efflux RND transporter permease subunit [Spirochaetia bacterium]
MTLSQRIIDRPVAVTIVYALVLVLALFSIQQIALELIPSISPPYVMVSTTYSGAGPETVEKTVTRVLESGLSSVQGVEEMTSTSSDGSSQLTFKFAYGKDLDKAASDIRDKIDTVRDSLPEGSSSPAIFKLDPNSMPIIKIALRGSRSADELKAIAEDTVQPRFEGTDGVASVSTLGGREEAVRVDISQNRLEAYGLTIQSIASALAAQNVELGAGKIVEGDTEYSIRTTGAFASVDEDIAKAQVAARNGVPILLKDVATVYSGYKDVSSTVFINGSPGVYLSIMKQSGSNSVKVANAVYASIEELNAMLPGDIRLEIINDDSTQVRSTLYDLIKSIATGACLTLAFVLFFLRDIRSMLLIGITMTLAIMVTLLAMYVFGFSLNMMTMAGLLVSVGTIVDSSIVVIDSISVYRERGTNTRTSAILGTHEVMTAVLAGALTNVGVFFPVIFFRNQLGMMGIIFQDMIFTIIIANLVCLVVAVTLVPVLASRYLPIVPRSEKPLRNRRLAALDAGIGRGIDAVNRAYRRILAACLRHRGATIGLVVAAIVGSVAFFLPRLTIVFSPPMEANSVTLSVTMPLGTRFEETQAVLDRFAEIAQEELKGVKDIIATTGSSGGFMGGGGSSTSYKGSLTVSLPDSASERVDDFAAVKEKLRAHFKEYPSASFAFQQGMRMSERDDIDVTLTSNNYEGLAKAADDILELIRAEMPEILEPATDTEEGLPQIEIRIDRERAASFGISVSSIATEIRDAAKGYASTVYRKGGDEYDVWLRLQDSDRSKILDLDRIFVLSSAGERVPLSSLATLAKGTGPVKLHRTNQSRTIDITGGLAQGQQANEVEARLRSLIAAKATIPGDVYVKYTGSWSEITDMITTVVMILALSLILIYGIMAAQYESLKDPLINMTTIPVMIIGVLGIYFLKGQDLSMFTIIGVVMLIGIVINNGILLVDCTNLLRSRGAGLMEACIEGGASRFRPVLMTAGTTIVGEIPMAFMGTENAGLTQPIGLAVLGGMITATFITLVIVPVIYYVTNYRGAKKAGTL